MPELPEVETVRRHLAMHVAGQQIHAIDLRRADLRYPIPLEAVLALAGQTVTAVRRRAKYLLLDCGLDVAMVHLGMSGRLFVEPDQGPAPWQTHEHWRAILTGQSGRQRLRYVDARRFGALDVFPAVAEPGHALLRDLGPEPLGPAFSGDHLLAVSRGLRQAVKTMLMDGHRVVGIGNIYASETCYRAKVHPLRQAQTLTATECDRLYRAACDVLQAAIAAGGSTLRDFVGGDSAPGYFQQQLDVYDRAGEPCNRCSGDAERVAVPIIEHAVLANRATYFCPVCQR